MKKPSMISVLLFLTGLLCIVSLFFFNKSTLERIITTEKDVDAVAEQIAAKQQQVKSAADKYTAAVDSVQANINRMKQKQQTASQKKVKEKAEVAQETESRPSVFSQNSSPEVADGSEDSDSASSIFSSEAAQDGHIIGIDPGHQSEAVDMSALEPNGPGSSDMKANQKTSFHFVQNVVYLGLSKAD